MVSTTFNGFDHIQRSLNPDFASDLQARFSAVWIFAPKGTNILLTYGPLFLVIGFGLYLTCVLKAGGVWHRLCCRNFFCVCEKCGHDGSVKKQDRWHV